MIDFYQFSRPNKAGVEITRASTDQKIQYCIQK